MKQLRNRASLITTWTTFPICRLSHPIVAIIGAFTTAIVATLSRARVRELEIRERIAMIEKGLVPPPEVDPHGFDRPWIATIATAFARPGGTAAPASR